MKFRPQVEGHWRHPTAEPLGAMHAGVACGAECGEQAVSVHAGLAVVNNRRSNSATHPAAPAVAAEDAFTAPAEEPL